METQQIKCEKICMQDIIGREEWKAIFYSYLLEENEQEELGISSNRLFLFLGQNGSGKTALANAFAQLMQQKGYVCQVVYADELEGETREQTKELLKQFTSRMKSVPACFVILKNLDEIEDLYALKMLLRALYELQNQSSSFICVATAQETTNTVIELQYFETVYLENPDKEERRQYLKKNGQGLVHFSSAFDMEKALEWTEGFSFGTLHKAVQLAKRMAVGQMKINLETTGDSSLVEIQPVLFQKAVELARKTEITKKVEVEKEVEVVRKVVVENIMQEAKAMQQKEVPFQEMNLQMTNPVQMNPIPEAFNQSPSNVQQNVHNNKNENSVPQKEKKIVRDKDGNVTMDSDIDALLDDLFSPEE